MKSAWTIRRLSLAALVLVIVLGSGCIASNNEPAISSLEAEKNLLELSSTTQVKCVASDADGDELDYRWSASGGVFNGNGAAVSWTAPHAAGEYTITVAVTDGRGGEATEQLILVVIVNNPPVIMSLTAVPTAVKRGVRSNIECIASDADGDELDYRWSASGGVFNGSGPAVSWTAPHAVGEYTITVAVTDGRGGEATEQMILVVIVNNPPVIESLTAVPTAVKKGVSSDIECVASDPDGDELDYRWSATGGEISGQGSSVSWTAPDKCGSYFISVIVADSSGGEAGEQVEIKVNPG